MLVKMFNVSFLYIRPEQTVKFWILYFDQFDINISIISNFLSQVSCISTMDPYGKKDPPDGKSCFIMHVGGPHKIL